MIPKVSLRSLRCSRPLRFALFTAVASFAGAAGAHDFERTQVTLTFARDGGFVLDVANDAVWLEHRLVPFRSLNPGAAPSFADRIVLFVDGREIRPTSVERVGAPPPPAVYS